MTTWSYIAGIIAAALGLALISLIESALVSVNRVRLRQLIDQQNRAAVLVERMTGRPQELLGALVVMVNVFVLLSANFTTIVAGERWWVNPLVLLLLLVCCEITPKTLGVYFAEPIALRVAWLAYLINLSLTPLVVVLNGISLGLLRVLTAIRVLPGRVRAVPTAYSEEDIKQLVTAGEETGEVEASEREMIHGVIEFSDTTAREVMVPRPDLTAVPDDTSLEEVIDVFVATGHSRIPVYQENADNIIGILYLKDILIRLQEVDGQVEQVRLPDILRPAFFVPESKKSDELLREMQRKRVHLAIVVDEYGGTAGIITIEDLIEEIVGDIIDEYDQERLEVVELPDGTVTVDGRASLEKIEETFDIPIPETEAETISGLITEQLGRIPEAGDRVVINGVEFTVIDVVHNRAEHLHAVVLPEQELPPEA